MSSATDLRRAFHEQRPHEMRMQTTTLELRDADAGTPRLAGYASVSQSPYSVTDWAGEYTETIARGAFGKSLSERADVRLLVNHEGVPLARTTSGTLSLREVMDPLEDPQGRGQTGLWAEADLDPKSPLVQTLQSAMSRGDLSEMSFAFQATRQEWNEDYSQRTINEAKLFDVSVVTYPANPATSVQLNSARMAAFAGRLREGRALSPEDASMLTQLLGVLSAADLLLDDAQEDLSEMLGVPNPDAEDDAETTEPPEDMPMRSARALALARARAAA